MQIVFLFYEGMTALDAIGPHEILCRLPGVKIIRAAKIAGLIYSESAHLSLTAEYALSDVSFADILLIPGAGSATTLRHHPEFLEWVRRINATTKWTTSVCTGS
jgi:putative intracellular protease/amidase